MFFYILLLTGILLDLFTKYIASLYLHDRINILGDFLYFEFILNPGIAFGIKINPYLLKIITISLIIGIFYYYIEEKKKYKTNYGEIKDNIGYKLDISFSLILAGAIGNGIERILNSNVIDFIGIKYFSIFNLADSFITIGAILYLYILYKYKQ